MTTRKILTLMMMMISKVNLSPSPLIPLVIIAWHRLFLSAPMNEIAKTLFCPKPNRETILVIADDEEDMLEHYLAEKSDSSTHSSRRAN